MDRGVGGLFNLKAFVWRKYSALLKLPSCRSRRTMLVAALSAVAREQTAAAQWGKMDKIL